MKSEFKSVTVKALAIVLFFTVFCGVIYPLVVTGLSQLFFPHQANGSIIQVDGKSYGSSLLGQQFTGQQYLWGRVQSLNLTTFVDKNGKAVVGSDGQPLMYAGPSNKSPAGEELEALIAQRVTALRTAHPDQADSPIPVDLVTTSGSGLDPHISPAAAEYQLARVAAARGISQDDLRAIIKKYTDGRFLGMLGEPRVNVLEVNLALDGILK